MSILDKLLQKRGIKKTDDLEPEEKETFENWRKILSKEDLTIEDIKDFCKTQISVIEMKWKDLNIDNSKKAELIPYHTVYKTLEQVLNAPRSEREQLEAQLNQLLIN
ncbi:MAG: hypothetical protein WCX88_02095 [Patescibacteria group bacterium]